MKKLIFLSLLGFLISCEKASFQACNFLLSPSKNRVSWKAHLPIELYIDQSVPKSYYKDIKLAIETWNKKSPRPVFKLLGSGIATTKKPPLNDGQSVIYLNKKWDFSSKEFEEKSLKEQARTFVHYSGNEIYEADILINGAENKFRLNGTPNETEIDLQSVLVHELGHVLGFSHTKNEKSLMHPYLSLGEMRREISLFDQMNFQCEYQHSFEKEVK